MTEPAPELSDVAAELARELVAERFPAGVEQPRTLAEMEEALAWVKRELGERLQRRWLERQETETPNQLSCGSCPGRARFCGWRERTLVTRHGEVRCRRRYYHCATCHTGDVPLDRRLGLDTQGFTAQVRVWLAELGSEGAFAVAAQRLAALTDVRLSESTLARVTLEAGRRLRREELQEAEQILAGVAVPRRTAWEPTRLYISMDGTMMPLREAWKRDRSLGALECRYGECKVAVCYETRLDPHGRPVVARRQYTATLATVATFEKLVAGLAYHCGSDQARQLVVLADGLAYNWRIAAEYFPEALQILDFYHALEHLHTLARLCLKESGKTTAAEAPLTAATWVAARKEELLQDGVGAVCTAIRALSAPTPEAREGQDHTAGYFERNAERMRYRTFLDAGYQIGSGVMEAACKTVVHQRLDQSGMHWRVPTAEAVVALRANQLGDQPRPLHVYCQGWH